MGCREKKQEVMIRTTLHRSMEKMVTVKVCNKVRERERERGWFERRRMSYSEHFWNIWEKSR